jgi:hypothetical protein
MGTAGILLHMRIKRSDLKADPTQIECNHLASRDYMRGSTALTNLIVSENKEIYGNSKKRVESKSTGLMLSINAC